MQKLFSCLAVVTITLSTPALAFAQNTVDTSWMPPDWGRVRVMQIPVSGQGVVLNFGASGAVIRSVTPSNLSYFVFRPLDGVLCNNSNQCSGSPPTQIYMQRIQPLRFQGTISPPGGRTLLLVNTSAGLYRFELVPSSYKRQTLINIGNSPR
jgi:hypothetical protein